MKKENWAWMPHAGHFILGHKCRFRLNTYVGKYLVSTVGELWNERSVREIHAEVENPKWLEKNKHLLGDEFNNAYFKKFGYEEIGNDRTYETMVFKACKTGRKCCPYEVSDYTERDFMGYSNAGDAYRGHLKLCNKWSDK